MSRRLTRRATDDPLTLDVTRAPTLAAKDAVRAAVRDAPEPFTALENHFRQ
jgi:hypothetical protein